EREFEELMKWVKDVRFERMGAFAYSQEEGTYAAKHYRDEVPEDVKQERLQALMDLQEGISQEIQENKVGQTLRVIVDREEPQYYIGRTQWDSPEVDPEVLIEKTRKLVVGDFTNVTVTQALPFELMATPAGRH
ncbi:MAG TPA: 30S ribosomal protein S12 methylthiotransferase RimO, partial [Porphyromonadaceae bacterium]|nr:30S ribosomal protein S12 methylthiotransferase RimO [Porphyromonadaceae bacterium]